MVGRVGDTLIDPFSNRVVAFVVNRLPPEEMYVVPWSGLKMVTPDRLLIWASIMVVRAEELFPIKRLLRQGAIGQGTVFRTTDGQSLGAMADFYFDERTGVIIGYEIIRGDSAVGNDDRSFLPAPDSIALDMSQGVPQVWFRSHSRFYVKRNCVSELTQAFQQATSQTVDTNAYSQRLVASRLLQQTVGCLVQHSVTTEDGYLVAVQGQMVTDTVVGYAREKHSEAELLAAIGFNLTAHLDVLPPSTG
jgi:uncharacterized protein YrrD